MFTIIFYKHSKLLKSNLTLIRHRCKSVNIDSEIKLNNLMVGAFAFKDLTFQGVRKVKDFKELSSY